MRAFVIICDDKFLGYSETEIAARGVISQQSKVSPMSEYLLAEVKGVYRRSLGELQLIEAPAQAAAPPAEKKPKARRKRK